MRRFWYFLPGAVVALLLSCGPDPSSGNECIQIGPPVGYPLRSLDEFIVTGFAPETPSVIDFLSFNAGNSYIDLDIAHYPQTCFSSFPDRPNYRFVGWIDSYAYADGGQPPQETYCTSIDDSNCHPQPGQPQGEVTVTLYGHQNNVVIIPITP